MNLVKRSAGDVARVLRYGSARGHTISNDAVTLMRSDRSDVGATEPLNLPIDFPSTHKSKFND